MKLILSDSTEVEVEIDRAESAFDIPGTDLGDRTVTFSRAMRVGGTILKDAIESIRAELEQNPPNSLALKVGLKVGLQGSIVIAKGTSEAMVSVKAVWERPPEGPGLGPRA